jgi:hypothetical protein
MALCLYSVEARLSVPFSFYHRQFNSLFVSKTNIYCIHVYTRAALEYVHYSGHVQTNIISS